ncbi:MAG TPA: nuclear transport factor 2 family protein [Candidatus Acidoferrales bacterium]|nr:nuclear transport factor 2 family protein [Candidatus Acidoferrales bacterium]
MSSNSTNADLMQTVQELAARVQRLEDTIEIQSLQSKYIHYLFKQRFDRIVDECFAKNLPDVSVEFSDSGVYRGLESVRALYRSFDVTKTIPGFFILHMTVNPVIEIANDGLSARSHWLSPGAAGSDKSAAWIWGPFYVDYVKEEGRWKIAHSNLVPLFRNRYETSWAQAPDHGTVRGVLAAQPDEPSTLYRPYNEAKKQCDIFANHPTLPQPY